MRKSKAKKGFSWIRMILMLAALIILGLGMYYLQQTADLSEERNGIQQQKTTQTLTTNRSENANAVQNNEPQLRTEAMVKSNQNLAKKNEENKQQGRSRKTQERRETGTRRTEEETRRTGEQMLDIVKKVDQNTLLKQQEAEVARKEKEGGERPQALIDADQKTRTKRADRSSATKKESSGGEAAKNLLVILEMVEKRNQVLVKKHKAPRAFLLGLSEQTNELIARVNKASDNAVCDELKTDVVKLQDAILSNREQAQFYEKELKKLSNVLVMYCG